MTVFRSLLFNIFFYGWTTVFLILCLPLALGPTRLVYLVGRTWAKVSLWGLGVICGLKSQIIGLENLPNGPCLIAAKHQSAWDTMIFCQLLVEPCHVLKAELTRIPIFGWYLARAKMIGIDRKGGSKALKAMVADAKARVADNRAIIIFPEGTRTAPGDSKPFHPGVAALYQALDLPIVPVALNSGLFWGRNAFHKRSGTITMRFLEPLPPGLPRKEMMRLLTEQVQSESDVLMREG